MKRSREKKAQRAQGAPGALPTEVELGRELARGGLAIYEREHGDGGQVLFHLVPADVARSLRFFVSRLQQDDDLTVHRTIAVTSALAGEGVTSVSRSLAAVLAHDLDRTVCVVETNWWPSLDDQGEDSSTEVASPSGTTPQHRPGLAGVLKGTCGLESAIIRMEDDRLAVLSAGDQPVGQRAAAVGGRSFTDLLDALTKGFDIVVIDVPPVLMASEAPTIARQAEATVLVVRQGVTTEEQVRTAIEDLAGCALHGVILNRTSTRVPRRLRRLGLPA